jgi:hypothetical protein
MTVSTPVSAAGRQAASVSLALTAAALALALPAVAGAKPRGSTTRVTVTAGKPTDLLFVV